MGTGAKDMLRNLTRKDLLITETIKMKDESYKITVVSGESCQQHCDYVHILFEVAASLIMMEVYAFELEPKVFGASSALLQNCEYFCPVL